LAAIDILVLYFLLFPEALASRSLAQIGAVRILLSAGLPVVVLLLASILPSNWKAILVYWKITEALPGHEAFTKYGPSDPRVDLELLRKNVGAFPSDRREQNAMWYRLYRRVATEPSVLDSHKLFLLFRDMAAISILLAVLVPVAFVLLGVQDKFVWVSLAVFLTQYLAAALAARHSGIRFVTTVLAEHSTRRITTRSKQS
jgi:hypothetical protein